MGHRSLGAGLIEWAIVVVIVRVHMPRDMGWRGRRVIARVLLAGVLLYKAGQPRGWELVCVNRNTMWLAMIVLGYVNRNIKNWICRMVNKDTIYMYVPPEFSLGFQPQLVPWPGFN